jgi:hypothetical protein
MGKFDIVNDIAWLWPYWPVAVLVVVAWFAVRWWQRKPPTI